MKNSLAPTSSTHIIEVQRTPCPDIKDY